MNSIEDLNQYVTDIQYEDPRPAAVIFNRGTPLTGTQSVLEGQDLNAFVGIEIELIINYATANVSYTIDVSNSLGATVEWATIPAHCTLTNPSAGVYTISGIRSNGDWDIIRSPIINTDYDYFGTFTYTSTINYLTSSSKAWTTTATVTDVQEWNSTSLSPFWFNTGTTAVTGQPYIVDSANAVVSWYCLVIPSNAALVSSFNTAGTGGSTSFNATTKILRIDGTNAQINSHLSSLTFTTVGAPQEHFSVTYRLTNLVSGSSDNTIQAYKAASIRYLGVLTDYTYSEDVITTIVGAPLITHDEAVGTEAYILQITPTVTAAVRIMSATGSGGSATWDNINKRLTISGTKTQVNSYINNISLTPAADYVNNITLSYFITINGIGRQTKTQLIANTATHAEVSNITLSRPYINDVTGKLFATNIPQITDLDTDPGNYTITLAVTAGNSGSFAATGTTTSNAWSYTGTKAQVNAIFSLIDFIPDAGVFTDLTVTYTQTKGAITQVNTTFTLSGPDVAFGSQTATNQSITVLEGSTHLVPVGNDIINVKDYNSSLPTYTINVSSMTGATVSFPIVAGTVVTNPSTGVYRISGISSVAIWDQIKRPTISLNNTLNGNFTYSASIQWNNFANTMSWTVNTTITNQNLLSSVTDMIYTSGTTQAITGYPLITDDGNQTLTYTVTVVASPTTSINTITVGGSGGTVVLPSGGNGTLTLIGNKTQVNSRLSAMTMNTYTIGPDFYFTYNVSTNSGGETGNAIQFLSNSNSNAHLSQIRSHIRYFTTDTTNQIYAGPLVTTTDSGTLTLRIKSYPTNVIQTMSSTGSGGTSTWNATTKILTLTGTKAQINSRLDNIVMTQNSGYSSNIILNYELSSPSPNNRTTSRMQYVVADAAESIITNIHLMRMYQTNYENTLFATNIPVITDTAVTGDTYTISLSSTLGEFAVNETNISSNWTFTGTKAECNAQFNQIKFYPNINTTADGSITYTQSKNGIQQLSRSIFLLHNLIDADTTTTFTSTTTWTPSYQYRKYGIDVLLVGGGGGGARGGGGGGAEVLEFNNIAVTSGSKSIIIGLGGNAGGQGTGAYFDNNNFSYDASNGQSTTFLGYTARGGSGGKANVTGTDPNYQFHIPNFNGGNSGNQNSGGFAFTDYDTLNLWFRWAGGGGGGAGGVGINGTSTDKGNGGIGILSNITGNYYGGGGGGGPFFRGYEAVNASVSNSPGGLGGGGTGAWRYDTVGDGINGITWIPATSGTANTGGGGGGGAQGGSFAGASANPGSGGTGVVIIKIHKD